MQQVNKCVQFHSVVFLPLVSKNQTQIQISGSSFKHLQTPIHSWKKVNRIVRGRAIAYTAINNAVLLLKI